MAELQNTADRGGAATLEEALLALTRKGNAAALQNMVDCGEAGTTVGVDAWKLYFDGLPACAADCSKSSLLALGLL